MKSASAFLAASPAAWQAEMSGFSPIPLNCDQAIPSFSRAFTASAKAPLCSADDLPVSIRQLFPSQQSAAEFSSTEFLPQKHLTGIYTESDILVLLYFFMNKY
jgi:hypothetical protein